MMDLERLVCGTSKCVGQVLGWTPDDVPSPEAQICQYWMCIQQSFMKSGTVMFAGFLAELCFMNIRSVRLNVCRVGGICDELSCSLGKMW